MRRLLATLALALAAIALPAAASAAEEYDKYDIASASVELSSTQAGAHPDFTTSFLLTEKEGLPYALTRDVIVELPPGLFGNPEAFPKCTPLQFATDWRDSECPQDAQVGAIDVSVGGGAKLNFLNSPIYNMPVPGGDIVARFGFYAGPYPAFLNVRLDPETNGLVASAEGSPSAATLIEATTTFWGVPSAPAHDPERLTPEESVRSEAPPGGARSSTLPEIPFMTNPTSCTAGRSVTITATSYQLPGESRTITVPFPQISGCGLVEFNPETSLAPTTTQGTSGSGLDYGLSLPTKGLEFGHLNYGSVLRRAEVTLPEGMSVNPSQAEGLGVCSEADLAREAYDSPPNQGCPESSKIGSLLATSPAIDRNAAGSLYVAKPYENPFGSLLALYMVLKIPERGVLVKLAGEVSLDPITGQVTTTFEDIPELPVADFELHFREGARAPLVTPAACGAHQALSELSPHSSPGSVLAKANSFAISSGPEHGPCPTGGLPPFRPGLLAGTLNNAAGAFSPFYLRLTRTDAEQEFTRFAIKLPPGIAAILAGVPKCADAAIAAAKGRSGTEELAAPSCPPASQIGRSLVGVGVGQALTYVPGKLYLAGPYEGAPISIAAITAAVAGPFDVGTVVIRQGFKIDPRSAEVFLDPVGSDPIPHIIDGITVHARDLRAYVDRPNFVFNPTSCEETSTASTLWGSGLDFASAADDNPVVASSRFQAADCAALGFRPRLDLRLLGATKRGGHPKLRAHLTMKRGESNIAHARVTLPSSAFLDQSHIRTVCTRVQFKEEACPPGSVYGYAKAITPVLEGPLQGPVYLRSSEHKLPDLVAALRSAEGIEIELVGRVDSVGGRIRNTFDLVPDAPVSSFTLTMQGGNKGLIVNSRSLCFKPKRNRAIAELDAHNGRERDWRPAVGARCGAKGKREGGRNRGGRVR
jgi:hypothetical protein